MYFKRILVSVFALLTTIHSAVYAQTEEYFTPVFQNKIDSALNAFFADIESQKKEPFFTNYDANCLIPIPLDLDLIRKAHQQELNHFTNSLNYNLFPFGRLKNDQFQPVPFKTAYEALVDSVYDYYLEDYDYSYPADTNRPKDPYTRALKPFELYVGPHNFQGKIQWAYRLYIPSTNTNFYLDYGFLDSSTPIHNLLFSQYPQAIQNQLQCNDCIPLEGLTDTNSVAYRNWVVHKDSITRNKDESEEGFWLLPHIFSYHRDFHLSGVDESYRSAILQLNYRNLLLKPLQYKNISYYYAKEINAYSQIKNKVFKPIEFAKKHLMEEIYYDGDGQMEELIYYVDYLNFDLYESISQIPLEEQSLSVYGSISLLMEPQLGALKPIGFNFQLYNTSRGLRNFNFSVHLKDLVQPFTETELNTLLKLIALSQHY